MAISGILLALSTHKIACGIIKTVLAVILIVLIFTPPVSSNEMHASNDEEFKKYLLTYADKDTEVNEKDFFGIDEISYFDQAKLELKACGQDCLTLEHTCSCFNESMYTAMNNSTHHEIHGKRTKRRVNGPDWQTARRVSKQRHLKVKSSDKKIITTYVSNDENAKKYLHFDRKPSHYFSVRKTSSSAGQSSDSFISFHQSQNIITNWGPINVPSSFTPYQDKNNIELNWDSFKKDRDSVYLKGTSISKLEVYPGSGINYKLSNKEASESAILSTYIFDYSQTYKTTLKFITTDRTVNTWFRGACTGDCPESCACESSTCTFKKWDYDRNLGCNPSWCWATNSGCSCCAMDVEYGSSKWIMAVFSVEYMQTEALICNNLGYDKLNCKVIDSNDISNYDTVKFTHSKVYSTDHHLTGDIAVYWYNSGNKNMKMSYPDGALINPPICTHSCNHGEPGDFKLNKFSEFFNRSKIEIAHMTWTGVDVEHTCHFASWPDCEFYGLHKENNARFNHLNLTSKHLSDDYIIQKLSINQDSQLNLQVRPKSSAGLMDVTLQVKNFALKRLETEIQIQSLQIQNCHGCYGCNSGAECSFSVILTKPKTLIIHLDSNSPGLKMQHQSFPINSSENNKLYKVHFSTIMNISIIRFCIKEATQVCSEKEIYLEKPIGILVESAHILHHLDADNGDCNGFLSFVACTGENIGNGVSEFLGGIGNMFSSIYNTIKAVVLGVLFVIISLFLAKFSILIFGLCKSLYTSTVDSYRKSRKTKSYDPNKLA